MINFKDEHDIQARGFMSTTMGIDDYDDDMCYC
jgi:hypothetical protein